MRHQRPPPLCDIQRVTGIANMVRHQGSELWSTLPCSPPPGAITSHVTDENYWPTRTNVTYRSQYNPSGPTGLERAWGDKDKLRRIHSRGYPRGRSAKHSYALHLRAGVAATANTRLAPKEIESTHIGGLKYV
ncbi:hypothetical protein MMC28_011684 [Mycoblastus sanguinarius]|nr:hypothetical protein [Mycoblastus sanguinarius]